MNINEQEKAINFVYKHDIDCEVPYRLLDLSSELGALSKMILKETDYGKKEFESNPEIDDKLGQMYFVFLELANEIGVNLDDALKRALEKNDIKLKDKENMNVTNFGRKEEEPKVKPRKNLFGKKK